MDKITPKQQRFVAEYLVDLNATQAAIRAGYSEKTAQPQSARLLSKVMVKKAVAAAQAERSERTEITQDYVLTSIMETMERCKQAEPVKYQNGDQVYVATPAGDIVPAYKFDAGAVLRGAELLGKHLAMFTDKQNVTYHDGDRQEVQERADAFTRAIAGMSARGKADKGETKH